MTHLERSASHAGNESSYMRRSLHVGGRFALTQRNSQGIGHLATFVLRMKREFDEETMGTELSEMAELTMSGLWARLKEVKREDE